jgi:hypothetical protein
MNSNFRLSASPQPKSFTFIQDDYSQSHVSPGDAMPARLYGGACGRCKARHLKVRKPEGGVNEAQPLASVMRVVQDACDALLPNYLALDTLEKLDSWTKESVCDGSSTRTGLPLRATARGRETTRRHKMANSIRKELLLPPILKSTDD